MSKGAISSGTLTIGIFAIIIGIVGAYGIRTALLPQEQAEEATADDVVIPVAACDLPLDRELTQGDVASVTVTLEQQRERSPADGYMLMDMKHIIGRRLSRPVRQGETFSPSAFYLEGTGPNIADRLKPGFRAVDIQVESANGGTVPVGSRVDVLFRTFPREGTMTLAAIPEMTMTMFDKVEVLDVRSESDGRNSGSIVTLAISADHVGKIQVVQGRGEFRLVARPAVELISYKPKNQDNLTLEKILGIDPLPAVAPTMPQIPQHITVIYRGPKRDENIFGIITPEYQQQVAAYMSTSKPGCKTCKKKQQPGGNGYPLQPIPASLSSQYAEPSLLPPQPTRAIRPMDNVSDM